MRTGTTITAPPRLQPGVYRGARTLGATEGAPPIASPQDELRSKMIDYGFQIMAEDRRYARDVAREDARYARQQATERETQARIAATQDKALAAAQAAADRAIEAQGAILAVGQVNLKRTVTWLGVGLLASYALYAARVRRKPETA